mgnify:CR=1 FL=1
MDVQPLSVVPCTACHLHQHAQHSGVGYSWLHRPVENAPKPILFIGEGPGASEDKLGAPFLGNAGKYLWSAVEKAGIPKEAVALSNKVLKNLTY